jgi:hypothetical protein
MKDKLKKVLQFMRKQLAPLICAVVVIIASVLYFWPTQQWFTDLEAKVAKSISLAGQVSTVLKHDRHLPILSLDPNAVQQSLPVFPTQDVYEKGLAAVKALGAQSTQVLDSAVEINTHIPLYLGALPSGSDFDRASFGSAYKDAVNDDSRIRNWPPPELRQSIPPLLAGRHITDDNIKDAEALIQHDVDLQYPPKLPNGQDNPDAVAQGKAVFAERTKNLLLTLEYDAAQKCKVYLESGAIKLPPVYDAAFKDATSARSPDEVWAAQLALWLDEDVATAVARANANAKNVMDAPVKQILDVTVKDPPYLISGDPTAGKEDQPLTPAPDMTPTGRVSNGMYDVVQFSVSLDVDGKHVPQLLDAMQKNQFITVLTVQSQAVDGYEKAVQRFIYGDSPVVNVKLVCEEAILHAWTGKFQPADAGAAKYATGGTAGSTPNLITVTTHTGG